MTSFPYRCWVCMDEGLVIHSRHGYLGPTSTLCNWEQTVYMSCPNCHGLPGFKAPEPIRVGITLYKSDKPNE